MIALLSKKLKFWYKSFKPLSSFGTSYASLPVTLPPAASEPLLSLPSLRAVRASFSQLLEKYFNFARYAKEDFEGDDDLKKKEVLSIIGQNLLMQDGKLVFEPIKYLTPIVEKYPKLEEQFNKAKTSPEQIKKDAFTPLIKLWYTRQDSNLWPSAPQADALSS